MGEACRLAAAELGGFGEACVALRDALWAGLRRSIPGDPAQQPGGGDCLPNTLNVSVEGVRGEALVAALDLDGVAVSSGSACAAGAGEPSHVLLALGRSADAARDGVRFSLGRTNTLDEIEARRGAARPPRCSASAGRDARGRAMREPRPGERVVVGMSGGVDSSVAAALLVEAGLRRRRHLDAPVGRRATATAAAAARWTTSSTRGASPRGSASRST